MGLTTMGQNTTTYKGKTRPNKPPKNKILKGNPLLENEPSAATYPQGTQPTLDKCLVRPNRGTADQLTTDKNREKT